MSAQEETKKILPLQYVKGVGPRRAEVMALEGIVTPNDLIMRVPRGYVERSAVQSISQIVNSIRRPEKDTQEVPTDLALSAELSIVATVRDVFQKSVGRQKQMLTVTVADNSGDTIELVFWNRIAYYIKFFELDAHYLISGVPTVSVRWGSVSFHHPEVEKLSADEVTGFASGKILPKYPLTLAMKNAGISSKVLSTVTQSVLADAESSFVEFMPSHIQKKRGLMSRWTSINELHSPSSLQMIAKAQYRMKYEELFLFQMMLAANRKNNDQKERGLQFEPHSPLARTLLGNLMFTLTTAQRRVVNEVVADLCSGKPMNRLLQGDVGSGKTIVALLCMLCAVDNGYQTVIMVPTEILAEQHANTIRSLVSALGLHVVDLTGGRRKSIRDSVKAEIVSGKANIIVGTHALFEADLEYNKLGLVVIDEQHRFGVAQRAKIRAMASSSHERAGSWPHMLVMSATPIPRTLSMTLYGELDVSIIDELPSNRLPIRTNIVFESALPGVYQFIREHVQAGRQAYIVYPLVEKSEKLELKSAVEHHVLLQETVFPDLRVGLLHGQMLWYEKEDAMRAFLNREYDVMVATTVVEVGIDVPNATIMLIQNAERFGLSQLHQLRGRVGRGADQSYCFLATKDHFKYAIRKNSDSEDGAKSAIRLRTMAETTDGFEIAEVDLKLRGPGDMMGTRQSGLPEFNFANLVTDVGIIAEAREDALQLTSSAQILSQAEQTSLNKAIAIYSTKAGYFTVA